MKDDYPEESDLKLIREWNYQDPRGLVEFLQSVWWAPDYIVIKRGRKRFFHTWVMRVFISTAGWSGNEDMIAVLRSNFFRNIYWIRSEIGGHYTFEIPIKTWNKIEPNNKAMKYVS